MEKETTRKSRKNGERTQRMLSFRVDNENWEWMQANIGNKGRLINELIKKAIEKDRK